MSSDTVLAGLAALERDVARLRGEVGSLGVDEVERRIGQLQQALTEIRAEAEISQERYRALERQARALEQRQDRLVKQVDLMQKRVGDLDERVRAVEDDSPGSVH